MHHPTDRITHTTAFVTPVVEHWLEREIARSLERQTLNFLGPYKYASLRPHSKFLASNVLV